MKRLKRLSKENRFGFTLIELLVVISIIGLLASVVLVALNLSRVKARDARRLADLQQIDNALDLYYSDNDNYPGSLTLASWYYINDNNYPDTSGFPPCGTTGGLVPYIPNVCQFTDPQGNGYAYVNYNNNQGYRTGAAFEFPGNQGVVFLKADGSPLAGWYQRK